MTENDVGGTLLRGQKFQTKSMFVLYFVVIVVSVFALVLAADTRSNRQKADKATEQSTRALCALRDDLTRRLKASADFLDANPNGIAGISPNSLRENITNLQRTIVALSDLDCT